MSITLAQFKTALAAAQTTYAAAVNSLVHAMVDLQALTATVEAIGGGPQPHFSQRALDAWENLPLELEHQGAGVVRQKLSAALRATAACATSSNVLTFSSVPSWILPGMIVVDTSTGASVGSVAAAVPGAGTLTLQANASNAVSTGDVLSFAMPTARISDQVGRSVDNYVAQWSHT